VFTETIDWLAGDDPQFSTFLPVTRAEAYSLHQKGDALSDADLNQLEPHRRNMQLDAPKGEEPRAYWSNGIAVHQHD
jgi:hypothetical protein